MFMRSECAIRRSSAGVLALVLVASCAAPAFCSDVTATATQDRPFPPSYVSIEGHRQLSPEDWKDPRLCGQCHTTQYQGWNGSMHSNSFKDPVYQALWALAVKANPENLNHCGTCHSPIGITTGTVEFHPDQGLHGAFTAPAVAEMGVSCDVCHTISGTNLQKTAVLEHGNASFIVDPGQTKRATLDDAVSPFHETAYSEHHGRADFCGNCHQIFHPTNNFPIERTYDEWKYSIYAQNGIQCQDCHMVPVDIAMRVADEMKRPEELDEPSLEGFAALGGPWRKVVHTHAFIGGNAVITELLNAPDPDGSKPEDLGRKGNALEAIKRLQTVASLKIDVTPMGEQLQRVKVKVTNNRAGHHLPTSLTEVRQVWLEVVVTDDQGRELLRSGTLTDENRLPPDTVIFNNHAVDKDGKDTILPWEVARFTEMNTIPPKGYRYGTYYFNLPQDAGEISVRAKLHYRSFDQGVADLLLGEGAVQVPSVEMVNLEERIPAAALSAPQTAQLELAP